MQEETTEMSFPSAGIDLLNAFCRQQPREVAEGLYKRSTPEGVNVQGFDPEALRVRGGSRPGLVKFVATSPVTDWIIQHLNVIVYTDASAT